LDVTLTFDNGPEPAVTPLATFRQDFPAACVPLRRGERSGPIESYVSL
jgi:hypothetical protein